MAFSDEITALAKAASASGISDAPEDGTSYSRQNANWVASPGSVTPLANRVIVTQASDLSGILGSNKEYFIDGQINMGSQSIEVPAGGLYFAGYNFDTSSLFSTADNYTMFTSPAGGSGNILGKAVALSTSGVNSQVYNIKSATGFEAIEVAMLNYNDCTSLGTIDNYRQGLEENSGRFGGSPSLTLKGTWAGGFRITTSITRDMSDTTTEPLFKAGAGFVMNSRFLTDMNVDLGDLQAFIDFAPANIPNSGTLQLNECIISRGGIVDSTDTNILPNITNKDLSSAFKSNTGIPNTNVGGVVGITTKLTTTISAIGTFYDLAGTWTASGLSHFDHSVNGRMKNLGDSPTEYRLMASLVIDGNPNREIAVRFKRWNSLTSTFEFLQSQTRPINSLSGGRDVGFFAVLNNVTINKNDYVQLQVANATDTSNVAVEIGSFFNVDER